MQRILRLFMLKIEINNVLLKSGKTILHNISTELLPNNVYSIIGKNGSGKTTFIKSITGLLDKNIYSVEGKVFFEEKDLLSMSESELSGIRKAKIKYVFQDAINSYNPLKTFKFYLKKISLSEKKIDLLLDYFLLPPKKDLFKMYPYEVSGGMAQRINFVLALSADPGIIILDEPTSGIDSAIANLFIEKIREFAKTNNNTVLLVTHDLSFAHKVSDSTAFLSGKNLTGFIHTEEFFSRTHKNELQSILNSYGQLIS